MSKLMSAVRSAFDKGSELQGHTGCDYLVVADANTDGGWLPVDDASSRISNFSAEEAADKEERKKTSKSPVLCASATSGDER